jgi:hypothetical protein
MVVGKKQIMKDHRLADRYRSKIDFRPWDRYGPKIWA